jgi:F-type H+-transporting ATPase subunit b
VNARSWLLVACLVGSVPVPALADSEDEVGREAAAEASHGADHGGRITLHEIVAGHEAPQFWGSVVNFALLVGLIIYMARKPTRAFLGSRRDAIERGIQEAAQAKAKAEAVQREYSERLKTLDQELAKLRADIAAAAEQDRARIVADAEVTAQRVKAETEALVARQAEDIAASIRREVVAAAVAAAERAVRAGVTPEDHRRLADTFVQELARVSVEKRA